METDINKVLADYRDAAHAPGGARLEDWVRRYPQHRRELARYAFYQFVWQCNEAQTVEGPIAEERFLARARAIRERLLPTQAPALTSLVEIARTRGLTVPALAQRLNISALEVTKLNQRLLRAATLPRKLVRDLADTLGYSFEQVAAYLRQRPTLAAGVSYRAEEAPRAREAQDFATALAESRAMTEAQKAAWRAELEDVLGDAEV